MEESTTELKSEHDLDVLGLTDYFMQLYREAEINESLSGYDRQERLAELRAQFHVAVEDLLTGDGKSARMLVDNGFADLVQP